MLQALSLSMFTGGLPLSQGIMHMGACVVPVGIEGGTLCLAGAVLPLQVVRLVTVIAHSVLIELDSVYAAIAAASAIAQSGGR